MHFVCIRIAAFETPLQKVTETKSIRMYWNSSVRNSVTKSNGDKKHSVCIGIAAFETPLQKVTETKCILYVLE